MELLIKMLTLTNYFLFVVAVIGLIYALNTYF